MPASDVSPTAYGSRVFLMPRGDQRVVVYSPTDIAAADCPFLLLRRLDAKLGWAPEVVESEDPMRARAAVLGDAHEARVLADYQETFGTWDGTSPTASP